MRKSRAGRPSRFSSEIAERILVRIAEGESVLKISRDPDMPSRTTIRKWIREIPEFTANYARMKECGVEALLDEALEIADDASGDFAEDENGLVKFNSENVQRSRLRVDLRKWIASKLLPRKYGEKLDLSHGVQPGDPLASLIKAVQGTSIGPVHKPSGDGDKDSD